LLSAISVIRTVSYWDSTHNIQACDFNHKYRSGSGCESVGRVTAVMRNFTEPVC
jgi:hypothetical protein